MKDVFAYTGLTGHRRELADLAHTYLGTHIDEAAAGADMDWFGIGIPESAGGVGGDFGDLAPIIEAAGATCASTAVPWTTGVAARLLVEAGGHERLLERAAAGSLHVALPIGDPGASIGQRTILVHGAPRPDCVLIPVPEGVAWVRSEDLSLTSQPSLDPSRFLHEVSIENLDKADIVGSVQRLRIVTAQVAALDAAGAARAALARTVAYSLDRHQFGRPIGSFQAYKHRCVEAFAALKLAQSAAFRSAENSDDALALAAAHVAIADCTQICGEAIQLHGGIGYAWESGLHGLLKRSRAAEIIAGRSDTMVDELLDP